MLKINMFPAEELHGGKNEYKKIPIITHNFNNSGEYNQH